MIAQPLLSALESPALSLAPSGGGGGGSELDLLVVRYQKTDAGRAEIRTRALALPRVARSLLLIMDERQTAAAWVQCLEGSTADDVQRLLGLGLISAWAPVAPVPAADAWLQALDDLGYEQLSQTLTEQAKQQLGLLRGLAFVLDIEKCAQVDELRALAVRLVAQVGQLKGPQAAGALQQRLFRAGLVAVAPE